MSARRIYLDYAASAPLRAEARQAMTPWLSPTEHGNPSSLHWEGRKSRAAIDVARERVSKALGSEFGEIVFTSGGTEAVNLAIVGAAYAGVPGHRTRILLSAAEHHSALATEGLVAPLGYSVELVPVDRYARIDVHALESMLADDVLLVSALFANNEVGTWQPVSEVARLAQVHGSLFHCDAVQAFGLPGPTGKPWKVSELGADLVSVSAHKLGGATGVGALYVKAGTKVQPAIRGGGQEREMRAGTENLAGIASFGAVADLPSDGIPRGGACQLFAQTLLGAELTVPDGIPAHPGICHLRFPGLSAETILIRLDRQGIAASSGAACSSGSIEPSHVLLACGFSAAEAKEGLRFSFGDETSLEEAVAAAEVLNDIAVDLRQVRAR